MSDSWGLTDRERPALAKAVARKLGTRCWDLDVWQVTKEVDGRVVIYPWLPRSFAEQELAVIEEQWDKMTASLFLDLEVQDHRKRIVRTVPSAL